MTCLQRPLSTREKCVKAVVRRTLRATAGGFQKAGVARLRRCTSRGSTAMATVDIAPVSCNPLVKPPVAHAIGFRVVVSPLVNGVLGTGSHGARQVDALTVAPAAGPPPDNVTVPIARAAGNGHVQAQASVTSPQEPRALSARNPASRYKRMRYA